MLESGTRLGPYRIDGLLGEGGMGRVYSAVDTRLDRRIAIKVLAAHLSSSPQLRERFEREARAISSLSHPNICALYDVGTEGTTEYLVMELVEGETLADRLARGRLPLDLVLRYGQEIASALAEAHSRGVIHRDLKPGNVMITRSGAKLLDFGLAKTAAAPQVGPQAATEQLKPLTAEGTLLGTFQYMAPEQLEGKEADTRTDIFALGALIYEMATGERAFHGSSRASLIASILDRQPPPIAAALPAAPASLDRLIKACLEKVPAARLQSAHDVATTLRWIADETAAPDAGTKSRVGRYVYVLALAVMVIATGAALVFGLRPQHEEPTGVHLTLTAPEGDDIKAAWLSPSGRIALEYEVNGETHMGVRTLADQRVRDLGRIATRGYVFWSPDEKSIGYFDGWGKRMAKVPVDGGIPRSIVDMGYGYGADWGDDGNIVFTPAFYQPLFIVPDDGGEPRQLTSLDASVNEITQAWPLILPEQQGILYLSIRRGAKSQLVHRRADGILREVIQADAMVGYTPPFVVFSRRGDLYAVPFDPDTSEAEGQPKQIASGVAFHEGDSKVWASVDRVGNLLYKPSTPNRRRVRIYDRQGRTSNQPLLEDDDLSHPRISPDGKRVMFTRWDRAAGESMLYRLDLERGTRTVITPSPRNGWSGLWHPDGERVIFTAAADEDYDLFMQFDDPQAQPIALWRGVSDDKLALDVTPDGKQILVAEYRPGSLYDLWLVPVDSPEKRTLLQGGPATTPHAAISPDGRWLVYSSDVTGTFELYVRSLAGGRSVQISVEGGIHPHWSSDGREIFFLDPERRMMVASFTAGPVPQPGIPSQLFVLPEGPDSFDVTSDDRFIIIEGASTKGVYNVVTGWKRTLE